MKMLTFMAAIAAAAVFLLSSSLSAKDAPAGRSGEELFKEHCAACHVNGGNILSPQKTLSRKDREANNIKSADDIVRKMRNPGPFPTHPQEWAGMKMFDQKTVSDDDARKIADYILKTFE
jgi:cytochrome c6